MNSKTEVLVGCLTDESALTWEEGRKTLRSNGSGLAVSLALVSLISVTF